ncbi:MAG: BrnA antitoxin family protein [Methylobacter sp.]|nr:BrnA antitoxin family protein [Methylobacter sp.]MDI1277682.1 BrnA antitoxin family protein [Methylobacter sp.]MDI1358245.1 BrnA antitoxin family protein [Methylobacter sp.]
MEYFRATGRGCQTRMNDTLKEWMPLDDKREQVGHVFYGRHFQTQKIAPPQILAKCLWL